jgi:hypothetical protein
MQILWGLLALALVTVASATASTTTQTARPTLKLVQRMPLIVQGAHFRPGERVSLTATAGTTSAAATTTTTRTGRIVARFDYAPPLCTRIVVRAAGRRGDRATLVVRPSLGSTGVPCGL